MEKAVKTRPMAIGGTGAKVSRAVKTVVLFALLLVYLAPFILIIINSLKTTRGILKYTLDLVDPLGVTFDNFVRADWTINKVFFSLMIIAMIIPFQVLMTPLISLYGNVLGVLDHRTTLIFLHVGFSISMAVFIYHGFIKSSVPLALEEAATLDGCSRTGTFFRVVFPLPSLILGKRKLFTLPLSTYDFYGTYSVDYGAIMAALVMTTIPVIILYIFLQKQIINGVTAGAVKM